MSAYCNTIYNVIIFCKLDAFIWAGMKNYFHENPEMGGKKACEMDKSVPKWPEINKTS